VHCAAVNTWQQDEHDTRMRTPVAAANQLTGSTSSSMLCCAVRICAAVAVVLWLQMLSSLPSMHLCTSVAV
jgi:hypothetical protein